MKDVTQMALVFAVFFVTFMAVHDGSVGQAAVMESGQAVRVGSAEPSFSVVVIGIVAIILLVTLFLLWHHENKYTV